MARPEQLAALTEVLEPGATLYARLGCERTVAQDALLKTYRKRQLRVHPDKCQDHRAAEAFILVQEAYMTLSDRRLRKRYDESGDFTSSTTGKRSAAAAAATMSYDELLAQAVAREKEMSGASVKDLTTSGRRSAARKEAEEERWNLMLQGGMVLLGLFGAFLIATADG